MTLSDYWEYVGPTTIEVYDVPMMQPIGFIWMYKPRYRVKAGSRKVEMRPEDVHPTHDVREEGLYISDPVCQRCRRSVMDAPNAIKRPCIGFPGLSFSVNYRHSENG